MTATPSGSIDRARAVVDLGSTSSRLLIVGAGGSPRIHRQLVTHMGEGAAADGSLSVDALGRVRDALVIFGGEIRDHAVDDVHVVATAAARRAPNREALAAVVNDELGCDLAVLDGAAEGGAAFSGVASDPNVPEGAVAVIDIGGRSTEIIVGSKADGVLGTLSLDVGAGGVTEEFLESDPPGPDELSAALSVLEVYTTDIRRDLPTAASVLETGTVFGVGGTITTAAAVEIGLVDYDPDVVHGFVLTKEAAEDVFRTLATESAEDRAFNPGLQADRVGVIVGGLCVLVALMRAFDMASITVSERDLLDGLAERP